MKILTNNNKILNKNKNVLKGTVLTVIINNLQKIIDVTKKTAYLFYNYLGSSVDELINYINTSNVTDMYSMFQGCTNLQIIPQLDTSKVTSMGNMFQGCNNLQTIPQLDTSNVTSMYGMFYNCENLQTIPQLDTSNVISMSYMFNSCRNLQTIDITSMDKITSTSNSNSMCLNCYSLTKLIIRNMTTTPALYSNSFSNCYHFTGTVDATYNPDGLKDGRIYVPDNMVDSLKSATNWSAYADIIVPLSSLEE